MSDELVNEGNVLTDELRVTFKEHFGWFSYVNCLFDDMIPEWRWVAVIYRIIVIITLTIYCYLSAWTVLLQLDDDLMEAMFNFNVCLLNGFSLICVLTYPGKRQYVLTVLKIFKQEFYDYGSSINEDMVDEKKKHNRAVRRIIMRVVFPLVIGCNLIFLFGKFLENRLGFDNDYKFLNGVYQNSPLKIWIPLEITTMWQHTVVVVGEVYMMAINNFILLAMMLVTLHSTEYINLQLGILTFAIETLEERAHTLYLSRGGMSMPMLSLHKKFEFVKCYNYCISQVVEHHKVIVECFDNYCTIIRYPVIVYLSVCSLLLATSGVAMLEEGTTLKVLSLWMFITHSVFLGLFCLQCDRICSKSENLMDEIYSIDWINCHSSIKRSQMIIRERLKASLVVTAVGMSNVNWELFSATMNAVYSYINLFRAMKA